MIVLYIILAIVVLLLMVLVHEFGHYIVGRMLNFKITEFSVGFGKALFSRKNKRGELISLRIFPLGGYCAFAGEDGDEKDKDSFVNQKPWKRILVFLAGVSFNFAFAVVTSLVLLCTIGYDIPQFVEYTQLNSQNVEHIVEGSYLTNVSNDDKLQSGDVIISIDGQKIDFAYGANYNDIVNQNADEFKAYIDEIKKDSSIDEKEAFLNYPTISAIVRRDGEYKEVQLGFAQVLVEKYENGEPVYNNEGEIITEYQYFWDVNVKAYVHTFGEALERAVPFSFGLAWIVLKSLFLLIIFQLSISSIGGPVTTIATIASFTQASLSNLLLLIPLISANLAVFNILPIPALDGAHVLFTSIEAIRKKPIKRETENMIHTIGLIVLFGAVILIDILHFLL